MASVGYSYPSAALSAALSALALRLEDPNNVFWTQAELQLWINEGLRVWQSLTCVYRERRTFNAVINQPFYDLASGILNQSNTPPVSYPKPFEYTVTDSALLQEIQYHLLELVNPSAWLGTDQFSLAQVLNALQARRDRFLLDTGCVVGNLVQNASASPIGRIPLPNSVIDIRRAAWQDTTNPAGAIPISPLWRSSERQADSFNYQWQLNPTTPPQIYSAAVTPPVSIQLAPPPSNNGKVDLLVVQAGAVLNPAGPVLLGIPNDFCWAVKYGTLADLLMADGQSKDAGRAAYCEQRYQLGVRLALSFPSVLGVLINGLPLMDSSVSDMDAFMSSWQSAGSAQLPTTYGMAGRNMLALGPVPNQKYGLTVDLVRNMPVPASGADFLQIGPDVLDVILDYAQHAASFKMGGQEFADTAGLFKRMLDLAAVYNSRLRQIDVYRQYTQQPAHRQQFTTPRLSTQEYTNAYSQ